MSKNDQDDKSAPKPAKLAYGPNAKAIDIGVIRNRIAERKKNQALKAAIVYVDREGQPIMEGMVVALAVTMNQRMHFNNFTTRICRFKKGELILDGASNWGFVKDYSAQEMQILHAGVDLTKLESDFLDQFGSRESFWRKEVSSQDAHDFYIAVVEQLSRQTVDYLDIKDSRQAKNILVKLLELSGLPDDKFKGKVDAFRLKFAAMQTRFNEACRDLSSMMDR